MSPIAPDYYYVNGGTWDTYSAPTSSNPANYKISFISVTYNATGTIATVTVNPPIASVGTYGGSVAGTGTFNDPDFVINSSSNVFTIGSLIAPLTPGLIYKLRIRAYSGANATGTY